MVLESETPAGLAAAAVASVFILWRSHPATRARMTSVLVLAAGCASVAWAAVIVSAAAVGLLPERFATMPPLSVLPAHEAPMIVTGASIGLLLFATSTVVRLVVERGRLRGLHRGFSGVVVIEGDQPEVYALPGRNGSVIISKGLLALLDADELDVVLAHERSHLRHRHDRQLTAARLGLAGAPWLWPLLGRIQFDLERWADEDAADHVDDRELVARTVARVALMTHGSSDGPVALLWFGRRQVLRRVEALLDPAPRRVGMIESIATFGTHAAATGLVGSALQLHHALPG